MLGFFAGNVHCIQSKVSLLPKGLLHYTLNLFIRYACQVSSKAPASSYSSKPVIIASAKKFVTLNKIKEK